MKRGVAYAPRVDESGDPLNNAGLEAFRQRYELSFQTMADFCGGAAAGVSKSSLHRLCTGQADFRFAERSKPVLIAGIRKFLSGLGKSRKEIQAELHAIFSREDLSTYDQEDIDVIARRETLTPEIQQYFRLRRDPFVVEEPRRPADIFTTPQLDRIAAKVEDAINYQGFVVVIGDIGSGKSIMKRRVIQKVEQSQGRMRLIWPEFFENEKVTTGAIVSYILQSFDQKVPSDLVRRAAKLKRVLADAHDDGARVAIGFDECHHLAPQVLSALKNFWELGTGGYDRYLGVVLFGQTKFEGMLRELRFREIVERVEVVQMPSFEKAAWDYVAHRVRLAGGDAERLFERKAVTLLAQRAKTPLALGNLANAALIKAHKLGQHRVLAELIDSDDGEPQVRAVRRAG